MTRISDSEVDVVADAIEGFLGGETRVHRESFELSSGRRLGVMFGDDVPRPGLSTAATFGLVHEDWSEVGVRDRIELVGAMPVGQTELRRMLFVVAREAIRQRALPKPGRVFADAMRAADAPGAARMPHALIVTPHLWNEDFDVVRLASQSLWFLQVVPLFDSEMRFIETSGFSSFEELLREDGVRFWDLERHPHA